MRIRLRSHSGVSRHTCFAVSAIAHRQSTPDILRSTAGARGLWLTRRHGGHRPGASLDCFGTCDLPIVYFSCNRWAYDDQSHANTEDIDEQISTLAFGRGPEAHSTCAASSAWLAAAVLTLVVFPPHRRAAMAPRATLGVALLATVGTGIEMPVEVLGVSDRAPGEGCGRVGQRRLGVVGRVLYKRGVQVGGGPHGRGGRQETMTVS